MSRILPDIESRLVFLWIDEGAQPKACPIHEKTTFLPDYGRNDFSKRPQKSNEIQSARAAFEQSAAIGNP